MLLNLRLHRSTNFKLVNSFSTKLNSVNQNKQPIFHRGRVMVISKILDSDIQGFVLCALLVGVTVELRWCATVR